MISPGAKPLACGTLLLLLSALPFAPARAQTETRPFVNAYAPDYFASSHPSSAYEMVGLLPSFQLVEGDPKVRGYAGSIGNVLIDGRPPTSKQETLETILRRITPDAVERIEILRTGAAGVDFLGYPMLANVVLKPSNSAPKGQVALQDSILRHGHSNEVGTARMSWGTTDVLDLTFTASNKVPDGGAGYGYRNNITPDGKDVRRDRYYIKRNDDVWNLTGGYRQPLFGGTVHLTGLYNELRTFAPLLDSEYFPVVSVLPGGGENQIGVQERQRSQHPVQPSALHRQRIGSRSASPRRVRSSPPDRLCRNRTGRLGHQRTFQRNNPAHRVPPAGPRHVLRGRPGRNPEHAGKPCPTGEEWRRYSVARRQRPYRGAAGRGLFQCHLAGDAEPHDRRRPAL